MFISLDFDYYKLRAHEQKIRILLLKKNTFNTEMLDYYYFCYFITWSELLLHELCPTVPTSQWDANLNPSAQSVQPRPDAPEHSQETARWNQNGSENQLIS